jgi:hypothetical protein
MYLALFLGPWVLMYAASTFVMNHRTWFRGETPKPPDWELVSRSPYAGEFPPGADKDVMARQILAGLNLDGAHQTNLRDGKLTIQRNEATNPLRISYNTADNQLMVERQKFEAPAFLERMHRRRGFQQPYALEDAWAFSVDLFIGVMLFWTLSGIWMWWEMKATRNWGAWSMLAGATLFAIFLGVL